MHMRAGSIFYPPFTPPKDVQHKSAHKASHRLSLPPMSVPRLGSNNSPVSLHDLPGLLI